MQGLWQNVPSCTVPISRQLGAADRTQMPAFRRDDPESARSGDVQVAALVDLDAVQRFFAGCAGHVEEDTPVRERAVGSERRVDVAGTQRERNVMSRERASCRRVHAFKQPFRNAGLRRRDVQRERALGERFLRTRNRRCE